MTVFILDSASNPILVVQGVRPFKMYKSIQRQKFHCWPGYSLRHPSHLLYNDSNLSSGGRLGCIHPTSETTPPVETSRSEGEEIKDMDDLTMVLFRSGAYDQLRSTCIDPFCFTHLTCPNKCATTAADCDIRSRNAAAPPLRNPALSVWGLSVRQVLHLLVTRVISNDLKWSKRPLCWLRMKQMIKHEFQRKLSEMAFQVLFGALFALSWEMRELRVQHQLCSSAKS